MCRDLTLRGSCPRGTNCTFAHSADELEKYRAKNRQRSGGSSGRRSDSARDSHSPNVYIHSSPQPPQPAAEEAYYTVTPNVNISPMSVRYHVPTALPTTVHHTAYESMYYPSNGNFSTTQPLYATELYPAEMYSPAPHNVQFFPTTTSDYPISSQMRSTVPPIVANDGKQREKKPPRGTKSLAELQQRKQEVISQLEKVVGKNKATAISNTATNNARQEHEMENSGSPFNFNTSISHSGPTFVRSDSILTDDDYVPYDGGNTAGKYGPISRMPKDNMCMPSNVSMSQFRDPNMVRLV